MMAGVNVLLALEQSVANKLKQNFQFVDPQDRDQGYVRNDLTQAQREKLRGTLFDYWKGPTFQSTTYVIIALYLPATPMTKDDLRLKWLETLFSLLPGTNFILGAWNPDGSEYGTWIIPPVYDPSIENAHVELEPERIVGTPVYPIDSRVLANPDKIFPDDLSGTPAAGPKEVINIFGWKPRRWA